MEIKRLSDSSFVQSEEKLPDLTSVRQEEPQSIASIHDSLESFATAPRSFENLTASAGNHFAEMIQQQRAAVDNSEIRNLTQALHELTTEKNAIIAKIKDLENQLMATEVAYSNSPNAATAQHMIDLQRQIANLQSQLSKVDLEIKQIMNQIQQKQAEEDAVRDSTEAQQEQEQNLMQNLDKAADAYSDILKATDILD
jgi:chromosome segregation ATPase